MKKAFLVLCVILLSTIAKSQWTDNGSSITTSDNVGIGTTSTQIKLHVYSTTPNNEVLRLENNGGRTTSFIHYSDGTYDNAGLQFKKNSTVGQFKFSNNNGDLMTIRASGKVGIGTTSPNSVLEISDTPELDGTSPVSLQISANRTSSSWVPDADVSGVDFYSNDGSGRGAGIRSSIKMFTDNAVGSRFGLRFNVDDGTNYSEALRIDPYGNIGIGTNSPAARLHVKGGSASFPQVRIHESGGSKLVDIGHDGTNAILKTNEGNILLEADNVGIGTDSPNKTGYQTGNVLTIGNNDPGILELASDKNSNTIGKIDFYGTGVSKRLASITAFKSANDDGQLRFYTQPTNGTLSEVMRIDKDGNVGIGTSDTFGYKLAVNGTIGTKEVKVEINSSWPDFVFDKDYELRTLEEVEKHIEEEGHLPEIPSEAEVLEEGVNLGEMNAKLLQKVEELTLYLIEQNQRLEAAEKEIAKLKEKG